MNTFAGGVDFTESVLRLHPQLKEVKGRNYNEKVKIISKYVDDYYSKNTNKIKKKLLEIQTAPNIIYPITDLFFIYLAF